MLQEIQTKEADDYARKLHRTDCRDLAAYQKEMEEARVQSDLDS